MEILEIHDGPGALNLTGLAVLSESHETCQRVSRDEPVDDFTAKTLHRVKT